MKRATRRFGLAAAFVALTAASGPVFRHAMEPTVVSVGERTAVIAAAATTSMREIASRTTILITVSAGSGETENAARVDAVENALRGALPDVEFHTRTFSTVARAGIISPQLGGRVAVVVPGAAAPARAAVARAIDTLRYAQIGAIEGEPSDCAGAQRAAVAHARAYTEKLAAAAAAAAGQVLDGALVDIDRTVPVWSSFSNSLLCAGADQIVISPLDGGSLPDDRSTLRATTAVAFRTRTTPTGADHRPLGAPAPNTEPILPYALPREVEMVARGRSITFAGVATVDVAYSGDLVTYAFQNDAVRERGLRDSVRALGVDVTVRPTATGERVLIARVPRGGTVNVERVVGAIATITGADARNVDVEPYADCAGRDEDLVYVATREAERRAMSVSSRARLPLAGVPSILVTEPVDIQGCRSATAPEHRSYERGTRVLRGSPASSTQRTVVVGLTYVLASDASGATALPQAEPTRQPDDVVPRVRPQYGNTVASTTAARTLTPQRVDLDVRVGPDNANHFRAVDPADVEAALQPWLAGANATIERVTAQPRFDPGEHDDIGVVARLDRITPAFTEPQTVESIVQRLGMLGYPTVGFVARAASCRAAADDATVDALRRSLVGTYTGIVVGAPVVRSGACGAGPAIASFASWSRPTDTTVRVEVTARVYR